MSGYKEHNFPAFREAARQLRARGYDVISPAEMDEEQGFDVTTAVDVVPGSADWAEFLARDVIVVASSEVEGVVVLEGWEKSRGAALEVHVARELGKPIYEMTGATLEPVKAPTKYHPPSDENVCEEAIRLVHGDRGDAYGPPGEDFTRTAVIMSTILGVEVRPEQVPLLMIAVKLSRLVKSPQKRDSVSDICGYALTYEDAMNDYGSPLS
jgi:hypothetical protein